MSNKLSMSKLLKGPADSVTGEMEFMLQKDDEIYISSSVSLSYTIICVIVTGFTKTNQVLTFCILRYTLKY